ncbi:MAG: tRNA (cmo5U34)-methyltransferase, partial [Fimbriimonadaceae bacterium]
VTYNDFESSSLIILNLVLQFIRPQNRPGILSRVHSALTPGGMLILHEKTILKDPDFNALFIDRHHDMKRRNGYSDLEIARKRVALENVLVPYTDAENEAMLREAGFSRIEKAMQWLNFSAYIALK